MNRKSFFKSLLSLTALCVVNPLKVFSDNKPEIERGDFIYKDGKYSEWFPNTNGKWRIAIDPYYTDIKFPEGIKYISIVRIKNKSIYRKP